MSIKVLTVFGTRPEAIKMAPIVEALRSKAGYESKVCVTGQHRQMLDQCLKLFDINPDFDLNVMRPKQTLNEVVSAIFAGMDKVLSEFKPDYLLVQGDTATTMAAAVAAFYHRIKVGHVEAGLRSGDLFAPWPEEANRRIAGIVTHLHFAPTEMARENLLREGIPSSRVFVTGNTGIDALLSLVSRIRANDSLRAHCEGALPKGLDPRKRLILVTGHRRESFGQGLVNILLALRELARRGDVQVLYPVHMNPNVRGAVHEILGDVEDVFLCEPMDYAGFVHAMTRAYFIITDSGGIQEEAPALGKPLLITRTVTERPEAVLGGTGILVGTDKDLMLREAGNLLDNPTAYASMSRIHNALGDGHAANYIVKELK